MEKGLVFNIIFNLSVRAPDLIKTPRPSEHKQNGARTRTRIQDQVKYQRLKIPIWISWVLGYQVWNSMGCLYCRRIGAKTFFGGGLPPGKCSPEPGTDFAIGSLHLLPTKYRTNIRLEAVNGRNDSACTDQVRSQEVVEKEGACRNAEYNHTQAHLTLKI